jgi:NPCBM/NEW2 domain
MLPRRGHRRRHHQGGGLGHLCRHGDGRELVSTPVIRSGNPATVLDVTGIKRLTLSTTDGGNVKNSEHADLGHRTNQLRAVTVRNAVRVRRAAWVAAAHEWGRRR